MDLSPLRDANRVSVELLVADLDLALTFLQIARTSADADIRARNRQHARKAYGTVQQFLPQLHVTVEERATIEKKLSILKKCLEAAGEAR